MPNSHSTIEQYFNLGGKSVLITGASGQVGSELCETFLSFGCKVIATDLNSSSNLAIDDKSLEYFHLDITDKDEIYSVFKKMFEKHSGIDILINNAGVNTFNHSKDRTEADFDFVSNVNLKGTFFCIQSFGLLSKNKECNASIINTASHYGIISPDFRIYTDCNRRSSEVYGATKAGIIQMTKYFAVEYADRGIRVNSVSPGGIYNPKDPQGLDFRRNYSERTPLGRMAEVHEIMGAYIYLASDASSYTTGQNIVVDGGMTVW